MQSPGRAHVGVSGWTYDRWRGDFYPQGLARAKELSYIAERMDTVELNGTFYSLQRPTSFERWHDAVGRGFVFAVKGSRYVTHMLRLRGVETALANFFASGVLALGPRLGPLLWQLPESLEFEEDRIREFLRLLPRTTRSALTLARKHDDRVEGRSHLEITSVRPLRHVLEPRHESFDDDRFRALLEEHRAGLVIADSAGRFPMFEGVTTDVVYVRLHGTERLYGGDYSDRVLDGWAERMRGWLAEGRDVYAYFDNDSDGRAPWNALALAERLEPGRRERDNGV